MRWNSWILAIGFLIVAFAIGTPVLDGDFIRDDFPYIVTNSHVVEPVGLASIFASPFQPEAELGLYRPLVTLSFRMDLVLGLWIFGNAPDPRVFHAHNLVLAALAATLLARLARNLGCGPAVAFAAGLLFLTHAARSEAVFWISGRAENLMTLFSLASLVVASGEKGRWRPWGAAAFAGLAFLSKEQGAVLPVLIALLPGLATRTRLLRAGVTAMVLLIAFAARLGVLGSAGPLGAQQVLGMFDVAERTLIALGGIADYARLALWPDPLLNEYDDPARTPGFLKILAGAILLLAPVILYRRWRFATFAISLFLVPLLPILNVVWRTGESFAERFLALPLAGFALLTTLPASARKWLLVAPVLLAAVHAPRTFIRAHDFQDGKRFAEALHRDAPESGSGPLLLAAYLNSADPAHNQPRAARDPATVDRILALYRSAITNAPRLVIGRLDFAKFLKNLARPSLNGGTADEALLNQAEEHARAAALLAPGLAEPRAVLGEIFSLQRSKPLDLAAQAFRDALEIEPRETRAGFMLVQLCQKLGRAEEAQLVLSYLALEAAKSARDRHFDSQPSQVLSRVLFEQGRGRESTPHLEEAQRRALTAPLKATIGRMQRDLWLRLGEPARAAAVLRDLRAELEGRIGTARPQADLFIALSDVADLQGDRAAAIRFLERALPFAKDAGHRARLEASIAALRLNAGR